MDVELKTALGGIRDGIAKFEPRLQAIEKSGGEMQRQLDALDAGGAHRLTGGTEQKSLRDIFDEDDGIKRLLSDKRGKATLILRGADAATFERKTVVTESVAGSATSGVLPIGRLTGITVEPQQQLTIRDLLTATPTTFQVIDFVKVLQPMTIASPVPEAGLKPENQVTFTTVSERVKTIATWIPASRQIMDDMDGLVAFAQTSLRYQVNLAEELQLLSGDNVGENLHGLIPQATAFNPGLLSASKGWNLLDIIGRAIQQVTSAKELPPTFVVLNTSDFWNLRLLKDGFGKYLLGSPGGSLATMSFGSVVPTTTIFDLSVCPTVNIAAGTFLLGSGSPVACQIMDRLETVIDISTEHADYFVKNLIVVRCEKRAALITRRPGSFISGTFTQSPA